MAEKTAHPPTSDTPSWLRTRLNDIVLAVVIVGGIFGAMQWSITPLRDDIREMRSDINRRFEAVHKDLTNIRERLTKVETLISEHHQKPH